MYLVNNSKSIYVSRGSADVCLWLYMAVSLAGNPACKITDTLLGNLREPHSPSLLLHMSIQIMYSLLEGMKFRIRWVSSDLGFLRFQHFFSFSA